MQIRHVKHLASLGKQVTDYRHTLLALHRETESTVEGCAMSRHIDLGDEHHAVLTAELHKVACLFMSIELARHTGSDGWIVELRVFLAFKAIGLIFGKMPMEHIDLISAQYGYLFLEFFDRNIASAHILKEAADAERWPVLDMTTHETCKGSIVIDSELSQRLLCPISTLFGHCLDANARRRDIKDICLIVLQAIDHLDLGILDQ